MAVFCRYIALRHCVSCPASVTNEYDRKQHFGRLLGNVVNERIIGNLAL